MTLIIEPTTKRLWLRQWRENDRAPFAALNADPEVMQYFPGTLNRFQSDLWIDFVRGEIDHEGWGLWALQHIHSGAFLGALGLHVVEFEAPFTPAVEIGWRLARRYWGHGFAPEAAMAALSVGFDRLVHRSRERELAPGDGQARDAARSRQRLRPPPRRRRNPSPPGPSRHVPTGQSGMANSQEGLNGVRPLDRTSDRPVASRALHV